MTSSFNISRWNITNLSLFFNMCMNQFSSPNILVWDQINTQPGRGVNHIYQLRFSLWTRLIVPILITLVLTTIILLLTITRGLLGTSRSDSTTLFSSPSVPLLTGTSQWATSWRLSNVRGDNDDHLITRHYPLNGLVMEVVVLLMSLMNHIQGWLLWKAMFTKWYDDHFDD